MLMTLVQLCQLPPTIS
nr:unnamed protein product [Callosobruchus analis]